MFLLSYLVLINSLQNLRGGEGGGGGESGGYTRSAKQ